MRAQDEVPVVIAPHVPAGISQGLHNVHWLLSVQQSPGHPQVQGICDVPDIQVIVLVRVAIQVDMLVVASEPDVKVGPEDALLDVAGEARGVDGGIDEETPVSAVERPIEPLD